MSATPVAFVVADSEEIAREAAERIEVDYDVAGLPSSMASRPWRSTRPPSGMRRRATLAFQVQRGDADSVAQAMKQAAHVVDVEMMNNRIVVSPLEPRAGIARYDAATDTMDLELTGQGLHGIRRQLAEFVFKIPAERIQLHAPDVGGGFGMKNFLYPEWILLLFAARRLGRPVRWLPIAPRSSSWARRAAISRRPRSWRSMPAAHPGARREDGRQSGRLSLGQRSRCLGGRGLDGAGRRLRRAGDRRRCARCLHQHRARSMPIAAPASPRPTTSSSAASRLPPASSVAIRPSCDGRI